MPNKNRRMCWTLPEWKLRSHKAWSIRSLRPPKYWHFSIQIIKKKDINQNCLAMSLIFSILESQVQKNVLNFYQIAVNQVLLCVKVVQSWCGGFNHAKNLVGRKGFQASTQGIEKFRCHKKFLRPGNLWCLWVHSFCVGHLVRVSYLQT